MFGVGRAGAGPPLLSRSQDCHCHHRLSGLCEFKVLLQQLRRQHVQFFFWKKAVWETKSINDLPVPNLLPRCQGFVLFCCYKISVPHLATISLRLKNYPLLSSRLFVWKKSIKEGQKSFDRKIFLCNLTRYTSYWELDQILNLQKISKWVYIATHSFHPNHLSSERPRTSPPDPGDGELHVVTTLP